MSYDGYTGPYQDKQRNRIWLAIDKKFHVQVPHEYFDLYTQDLAYAQERSGPRNLDSGLSEISIVFQAAVPKLVASKYTTSGVRRPSEL